MTSQEVAEAVAEWACALIPELIADYPYAIGSTPGGLPDVVVAVQGIRVVTSEPDKFPFPGIEQVDGLKCWDLEISVMAEQGEGADGQKATHQTLEGWAEALIGSIVADVTLGSRVQMISPLVAADLSEPFEERPNGDRGRALFLNATVAEILRIDQ